jgi:hypothetical protein
MRYHWGLAVGHVHAHGLTSAPTSDRVPGDDPQLGVVHDCDEVDEVSRSGEGIDDAPTLNDSDNFYPSDDSELGLDERDLDGWDDVELESLVGSDDEEMDGEPDYFTGT